LLRKYSNKKYNMNIDDLEIVKKFKTFQELETLFLEKIKDKALNEIDGTYFLASYIFLISDSWIIQDGGYEALQAANRCREIVLKTNISQMENMDKITASIVTLPPAKFILTKCDTYQKLESLLLAETKDIKDLGSFDATHYAKQFWHILSSGPIGIKGKLKSEVESFQACMYLITQAQLSDEYKQKMRKETISDKMKDYTGERKGCLNSIIFFIIVFFS